MAIETCYESNNYRYDFDTLYGTGWFVRKSDDYVSLMDTGVEAEESRKKWTSWQTAKDEDHFSYFDQYAETLSYTNRWTEGTER